MIEVGARQAQRAFVSLQGNPGLAAQVFAAVVTLRLAIRDEDLDLVRLVHLKYPQIAQITPIKDGKTMIWISDIANFCGMKSVPPRGSGWAVDAELVTADIKCE